MLATDRSQLRDHYDVIVIGSGYGGAITAARLGYANAKSGKRLKIAILERGIERPTGSFPGNALEFAKDLKTGGNPLGLFEFVTGPDFYVVQGSGLGGTSLVNGNVCIIPEREVFEQFWPRAIANEEPFPLETFYKRALAGLGAIRYADQVPLPKVPIFGQMSNAVGGTDFRALNLAVSDETRTTRFGIPRRPCVNCGSCISGCNFEAKNTLDKNYLPAAKFYGVEMFERMNVQQIQKIEKGGYLLSVQNLLGEKGTDVQDFNLTASRVVLAAGCLGTTGLLLRSQSPQFQFSDQLGERFSGNGDYFALAYNLDQNPNFNGWTSGTQNQFKITSGPTITTTFRVNQDQPLLQRVTMEEASMPAPFVQTLRNLAFLAAGGQPLKFLNTPAKFQRWLQDRYRNNTGAVNSSLLYLGMGFDGAAGKIELDSGGNPQVIWPNAADAPVFDLIRPITEKATAALGGNTLPQPLLAFNVPAHPIPVTGHPMGGCATADSIDAGVCDNYGRIYDPKGEFHDGLFVVDGSIFPNAIGVNVLLTISAFSERASDFMRKDWGLAPFNQEEITNVA